MGRKIAKTALGLAAETLIVLIYESSVPILVVSMAVLMIYLVWTWEGLPDWVAKHQADDAFTTLGPVAPPPRSDGPTARSSETVASAPPTSREPHRVPKPATPQSHKAPRGPRPRDLRDTVAKVIFEGVPESLNI